MNILLISANAMGDTYLTCSAIETLKNLYPESRFELITLKECGAFTDYLELNNVYFIQKRGAAELFRVRNYLSARSYDFVFSFFPGRMNSLLVMQAKAESRYFYRSLSRVEDWYKSEQYVYDNSGKTETVWNPGMNYLDRIKIIVELAAGAAAEVRKPLFLFPVNKQGGNRDEVIINFDSREEGRRIEKKFVLELSEYISRTFGKKVVIIDFNRKFGNKTGGLNFPENYDFADIMNLIVSSALFISVDSFLLHPADAYGARLLGIFGPTNPRSVLSYGKRDYVKVSSLKNLSLEDVAGNIREKLDTE